MIALTNDDQHPISTNVCDTFRFQLLHTYNVWYARLVGRVQDDAGLPFRFLQVPRLKFPGFYIDGCKDLVWVETIVVRENIDGVFLRDRAITAGKMTRHLRVEIRGYQNGHHHHHHHHYAATTILVILLYTGKPVLLHSPISNARAATHPTTNQRAHAQYTEALVACMQGHFLGQCALLSAPETTHDWCAGMFARKTQQPFKRRVWRRNHAIAAN